MAGAIILQVQKWATETPECLAIDAGPGARWTYAELWDAVDRKVVDYSALADQRVALALPNGPHFVIELLAVWNAGASVVPLDVNLPEAKFQEALAHTEVAVLVRETGVTRYAFSTPSPDVATLFYTSGSTGTPKAVMQRESNIASFACSFAQANRIGKGTRVSWLYSPGFSASIMDLAGSLMSGATICPFDLAKEGMVAGAHWLTHVNLGVLHTVPSAFRAWLRFSNARRIFEGIHSIDLGGEPIYPSDVAAWKAICPGGSTLFNHYAATEASVMAMAELQTPEDVERGWPVSEVDWEVVDESGQILPPYVPGVLRIIDERISPGYWNPTREQASTFDSCPRTGRPRFTTTDRVVALPTGGFQVVGRSGRRIKVNGFPVDLDEVERHLIAIDGIAEAAVTTTKSEGGNLIAWVVADQGHVPDAGQWRSQLARFVPSYGMPKSWQVLDQLPTTTSGKVDRKALESFELQPMIPASCSELGGFERLVQEWFELEIPNRCVPIESDSNFFELGGDSLAWSSMHVRFERAAGRLVSPEQLLNQPTVSGIAQALRASKLDSMRGASNQILVRVREAMEPSDLPPLFIVHGGQGEAFVSPRFSELPNPGRSIYAIRAHGMDSNDFDGIRTLKDWARIYLEAIQEVQPAGPYALSALCVGYTLALELADLLVEAGEEVCPIVLFDPPAHPRRTWRERYVDFKRKWLFKLLGLKITSSRDESFQNATSETLSDAAFVARANRIRKMYALYPTHGLPKFPHKGVRIAARKSLEKRMSPSIAGFFVLPCGQVHEDVLSVNNAEFRAVWEEAERIQLNQ